MRINPSPGLELGGYSLIEKIAEGGNGEIWRAEGAAGERAYKIVRSSSIDSEKYRRFQREIETLRRLHGSPLAVLPIFDASLPPDPAQELAWFSMPVAETLDAALRGAPLELKVRATRDIAMTLADLAALERIHHRDVKPANLYCHDGRYVIGDFGLVKRLDPQDESLTRPNHIPGPRNYLPPEAFLRPGEAEEGPIDVYCFAKTLWVLAAEEVAPPGGPIRSGDRWSLSRLLPDEARAVGLESLIERATSNEPNVRPTMAEVAEDLARWLHGRGIEESISPANTAFPSSASVADRVVELLDGGSIVGQREFVKAERRQFERALSALLLEREKSSGGDDLVSFAEAAEPLLQRYLALHLPLIEYESPLFIGQVDELARIANADYVAPGSGWGELVSWAAWWLGHAMGAFAISVANLKAVNALFNMTVEQNLGTKSLPGMLTPDAWRALMEAALPIQGQAPQGAQFDHLVQTLERSDVLTVRYPEFVGDTKFGAARYVFDFNFLGSLWAADRGEKVIGYWTTRHEGAHDLAARMHRDDAFRRRIASEAFGRDPRRFDSDVDLWVRELVDSDKPLLLLPIGYSNSAALRVLVSVEDA